MPSNKETLFQDHICQFLETEHGYRPIPKDLLPDQEHHIIEPLLLDFIKTTQAEAFSELEQNYKGGIFFKPFRIVKIIFQATPSSPFLISNNQPPPISSGGCSRTCESSNSFKLLDSLQVRI